MGSQDAVWLVACALKMIVAMDVSPVNVRIKNGAKIETVLLRKVYRIAFSVKKIAEGDFYLKPSRMLLRCLQNDMALKPCLTVLRKTKETELFTTEKDFMEIMMILRI